MEFCERFVEKYDKFMGKNAGLSYMFLNSFFECFFGILTKLLTHMPVQQIMFSYTLMLFFMNGVLMNRYNIKTIPKCNYTLFLLSMRGLIGHLTFFCFLYAVRYLKTSEAYTIFFTSPIFTGITGYLVLNEPFTRFEFYSALTCLIGIIFICKPPYFFDNADEFVIDSQYRLAQLVAILGSFTFAWILVLVRFLNKDTELYQIIAHFSLMNLLPAAIELQYFQSVVLSFYDVFIIFLVAIFGYLLQLTLTKATKIEKVGKASVITYTQIPLTYILGVIFFDEHLDMYGFIGTFFVLGTSVIILYKNQYENDEEQ